ncbi:MAG: hypothetical protein ACK5MD_06500 [Flavobacteriales bacterium]
MPIQLKEDDLIFKPNIGIGKIRFIHNTSDIISLYGRAEEMDIHNETECVAYEYFSNITRLSVFFHYDNGKLDYTSIHTEKLIVNNVEISNMNREELLSHIKDFHKSLNVEYQEQFEDNDLDISHSFDNIGLTVWFEDNKISDICVNPVFE